MDSALKQFLIDGVELTKFRAWEVEHNKTCKFYDDGTQVASPSGAIGGRFTYSFTPTGLGHVVVVSCTCGMKINITDFDNW